MLLKNIDFFCMHLLVCFPNFHRNFVIKFPNAYHMCFATYTFLQNYCPLLFFKLEKFLTLLSSTLPTFLKGFCPNFFRSFFIKCPSAYSQSFMIQIFFGRIMALCFLENIEILISGLIFAIPLDWLLDFI